MFHWKFTGIISFKDIHDNLRTMYRYHLEKETNSQSNLFNIPESMPRYHVWFPLQVVSHGRKWSSRSSPPKGPELSSQQEDQPGWPLRLYMDAIQMTRSGFLFRIQTTNRSRFFKAHVVIEYAQMCVYCIYIYACTYLIHTVYLESTLISFDI